MKTDYFTLFKGRTKEMHYVWMTVFGFGFIFFMTALGAALVFCFRKTIFAKWNAIFLGFASGIMFAASIWSLILPALEQITPKWGKFSCVPIVVGFLSGCLFLIVLDAFLAVIKRKNVEGGAKSEGKTFNAKKIFLAVTLHNIPEGLAVGFAFGAAQAMHTSAAYMTALLLSIGIGVQNFPEGTAISLPLSGEMSRRKAFLYGVFSGLPEPLFALLGYVLSANIIFLQPWLLSFSAGAMFFVIVDELLPSAKKESVGISGKNAYSGALAAAVGFVVMMTLDVMLG